MKYLIVILLVVLSTTTYAQNKKEQLVILQSRIDSLNTVVTSLKDNLSKENKNNEELSVKLTNTEAELKSKNEELSNTFGDLKTLEGKFNLVNEDLEFRKFLGELRVILRGLLGNYYQEGGDSIWDCSPLNPMNDSLKQAFGNNFIFLGTAALFQKENFEIINIDSLFFCKTYEYKDSDSRFAPSLYMVNALQIDILGEDIFYNPDFKIFNGSQVHKGAILESIPENFKNEILKLKKEELIVVKNKYGSSQRIYFFTKENNKYQCIGCIWN